MNRTPAGQVWLDLSLKVYDAVRDGDQERIQNLMYLSQLFEKEYPEDVIIERNFWKK